MSLVTVATRWWGSLWGNALRDNSGTQMSMPAVSLVAGAPVHSADQALQISSVWACVWLLANIIGTLPLFVYVGSGGDRKLARDELLWQLLHDTPNSRMTPSEFWLAMLLNLLLRGNAYARLDRNAAGDVVAMWPMPADQVEVQVLKDGSVVYQYRIDNDVAVLDASSVLHIKELGNGTIGMARLDYMRATTNEAANAQTVANKLFANGGKPTGVLMVDSVLKAGQRDALRTQFAEMAEGPMARLYVLEANMKYQQINLSPADVQLLETRRYTVEEIGRWFGVPAVLINHSNVTAWGSGIEQIIEGFYKFTVRPMLVKIEQAMTKRVLTPRQRSRLSIEFNFEGLLRASAKDRAELYSKLVQNGLKTRNECRQLENDPRIEGGDELTAQTNLAPLDMLRTVAEKGGSNAAAQVSTA
jgi:HK97 family phage portal protein